MNSPKEQEEEEEEVAKKAVHTSASSSKRNANEAELVERSNREDATLANILHELERVENEKCELVEAAQKELDKLREESARSTRGGAISAIDPKAIKAAELESKKAQLVYANAASKVLEFRRNPESFVSASSSSKEADLPPASIALLRGISSNEVSVSMLQELEHAEQQAEEVAEKAERDVAILRKHLVDGEPVDPNMLKQAEITMKKAQLVYANAMTKLFEFQRKQKNDTPPPSTVLQTNGKSESNSESPKFAKAEQDNLDILEKAEYDAKQIVDKAEHELEQLRADLAHGKEVDPLKLKQAETFKKKADLIYANAVTKVFGFHRSRLLSSVEQEGSALQVQLHENLRDTKSSKDSESTSLERSTLLYAELDRLSGELCEINKTDAKHITLARIEKAEDEAKTLLKRFEELLQQALRDVRVTEKEIRMMRRKLKKVEFIYGNLALKSDFLRSLVQQASTENPSTPELFEEEEEKTSEIQRKLSKTEAERKSYDYEQYKPTGKSGRTVVTLEIIPVDDSIDLVLLVDGIKSIQTEGIHKWFDNHEIVEMVLGLQKLRITGALNREHLDSDGLCDALSEQFAGDIQEINVIEEKLWFEA